MTTIWIDGIWIPGIWASEVSIIGAHMNLPGRTIRRNQTDRQRKIGQLLSVAKEYLELKVNS